jgi:hypothetical protein
MAETTALVLTHWLKVMWGAGKMTREEIEGVGYDFCDCSEMMKVYSQYRCIVTVVDVCKF